MTIGEFKALLKTLRDDAEVRVAVEDPQGGITCYPIEEVKVIYTGVTGRRIEIMVTHD